MKIRLVKEETVSRQYEIKEDEKGREYYSRPKGYDIDDVYKVQYEIIVHGIFGREKSRHWRNIISSDNKEEAEKIYNWCIENNTVRRTRETLKETEIELQTNK